MMFVPGMEKIRASPVRVFISVIIVLIMIGIFNWGFDILFGG